MRCVKNYNISLNILLFIIIIISILQQAVVCPRVNVIENHSKRIAAAALLYLNLNNCYFQTLRS